LNLWNIYRTAGTVDAKSVWRDELLAWVLALPLVIALLLRFGLPPLAGWLLQTWTFDLQPYYPLIMSFFVLMAPSMVGMVIGFLLLDERDERTLSALAVTPMPLGGYLLYRITLPLLLGFVITLAGYPLAGLAPLSGADLVVIALTAAFTGPVTALFLAGFADNKVSGFALVKILNTINMLPVAAYFVDLPWQFGAGLVPAYWPMKMLWQAAAGEQYLLYGVVGVGVNSVVTGLFLQHFTAKIHR
jgi:fluoroquinolone transport system permease protein